MTIGYLAFVLILEFINGTPGLQFWEQRGVRAGWLAIAQMPILVLLIGKLKWITLFTGVSYERLNILHRWSSYVMMLMAIFHFGFQARAWTDNGLFNLEWTTDECVPTGIAAFSLLAWINVSTWRPIRSLCYEFFVVQHIITSFGFIIALMYHLPSTALESRIWVYVPIGIYLVDRLVRFGIYMYRNFKPARARMTNLGVVVRVQVHAPRVSSWTPGSHILISFPTLWGFGQSHHPATIASSPLSHGGDILLLLKSHHGLTKKLLAHADEPTAITAKDEEGDLIGKTFRILIDGPYGGHQADMANFSTVCLIAGSTGITFILSLLYGLKAVGLQPEDERRLRRVRLVWVTKTASFVEAVAPDILIALQPLRDLGIGVQEDFFITEAQESPSSSMYTSVSNSTFSKVDNDNSIASSGRVCLPQRTVHSDRPDVKKVVEEVVTASTKDGEVCIAVCGPLSMSTNVRNTVARLGVSNPRQTPHLHVEGFAF